MKSYLAAAAVVTANQLVDEPLQMSRSDALGLVVGFLEGAVKAEGLDNIEACIQDVETVIPTAQKTYHDCATQSLDGKLACIKDFSLLSKEVKTTVIDCKHLKDDISKLTKIVAVFSNPVSFAWHVAKDLLVNGVNIFKDVEDAISAEKTHQWKRFGKDVGHATALVILGAETQEAFESGFYAINEPTDPEDIALPFFFEDYDEED